MPFLFEIPFATYLAFIAACAAIVAVPGPTVTVIIANSMRGGMACGLANVLGTQLGLAIMIVLVALGLETLTTSLAFVFDWLRLIGAAYLMYLGYKLLTADGDLGSADRGAPLKSFKSYFWQGFLVIWSNPKALLFFGAFIPQFVNPAGNAIAQTLLLGFTFMAVATLIDGFYAVAAGRAGGWLRRKNVRRVEIGSGSMLVGGGLWLGFSRGQ
ncbi:MAG: LysE family translocator [Pseudomonadota bacterium]